jgi:hypothetical protein
MYTAKGQLDVNTMLKQYSPLVRRLAHQMIAKLPANVELDDLIQVGMVGLTDALSRFDAAQGVQLPPNASVAPCWTSCVETITCRVAPANNSAALKRPFTNWSSVWAAPRQKVKLPARWA